MKEDLYDDRYGYPGYFSIYRCLNCGHKYTDAKDIDDITELYTKYYPRASFNIESFTPHKEINNKFISWFNRSKCSAFRWIPKNVRVLDIGCGFGQSVAYHKLRGCDSYGVEVDENSRNISEKYGYKIEIIPFENVSFPDEFFDYITLDQVIEHIIDPNEIMKKISSILKTNGKVIISSPNSNGWGANFFSTRWINWHIPYHTNYFSPKSMEILATDAGLVLEKIMTITNPEWLKYQWLHLATYPTQDMSSVFWCNRTERTFVLRLNCKIIYLLHLLKVNHLITCFFDIIGLGDNYLFILRKK